MELLRKFSELIRVAPTRVPGTRSASCVLSAIVVIFNRTESNHRLESPKHLTIGKCVLTQGMTTQQGNCIPAGSPQRRAVLGD
jgi:hypothetical protein